MASKSTKKTTKKKTAKAATKAAKPREAATKAAGAGKPRARKAPASPAPAGDVSASKRLDEKIAALGDWRGERLAQLRKLIHEVDPEVVQEWKWMGTPVWSHDGIYVLANAHKDKVKLTCAHGAQLRDPQKLFNAGLDGNKWRAIDFREGDEVDEGALAALLREAITYNRGF